jgi:hypothetical protein
METDEFNSPLSFYAVETDFGVDALSVQPEERTADAGSHAHDAAPFPYFDDAPAGGIASEIQHHDLNFMI